MQTISLVRLRALILVIDRALRARAISDMPWEWVQSLQGLNSALAALGMLQPRPCRDSKSRIDPSVSASNYYFFDLPEGCKCCAIPWQGHVSPISRCQHAVWWLQYPSTHRYVWTNSTVEVNISRPRKVLSQGSIFTHNMARHFFNVNVTRNIWAAMFT